MDTIHTIQFHFIDKPRCVYPFSAGRIFKLFLAVGDYKHPSIIFLVREHKFSLLGVNAQESKIAGSYGKNFVRNGQTSREVYHFAPPTSNA